MSLDEWPALHARELLEPLGDRWRHTMGVARQARRICTVLPIEDRDVLVAAAWLHDVGYAPPLAKTGFHPLDGARHLRSLGRERLAGLVAYHSGARIEAKLRGLLDELSEFEDECSAVSEALTYCDMTTGPTGVEVVLEDRLADIERRYGDADPVTNSLRRARPELERSVRAVQAKLSVG